MIISKTHEIYVPTQLSKLNNGNTCIFNRGNLSKSQNEVLVKKTSALVTELNELIVSLAKYTHDRSS